MNKPSRLLLLRWWRCKTGVMLYRCCCPLPVRAGVGQISFAENFAAFKDAKTGVAQVKEAAEKVSVHVNCCVVQN